MGHRSGEPDLPPGPASELVDLFRRLRRGRQLSGGQLAVATGLSRSHISVVLRGVKAPSPQAAAKIARALGATSDQERKACQLAEQLGELNRYYRARRSPSTDGHPASPSHFSDRPRADDRSQAGAPRGSPSPATAAGNAGTKERPRSLTRSAAMPELAGRQFYGGMNAEPGSAQIRPMVDVFVGPLVEVCTKGDTQVAAAWRRHVVLTEVCEELNWQERLRSVPLEPIKQACRQVGVTRAPSGTSPAPGTAAAPGWTVPQQLPMHIGHFAGRIGELAVLDSLLDQSGTQSHARTVVISAIGGTAGVGKTALALHWAHRVAHRFPDGQLYMNLRGFDPAGHPVRPAEAIRWLLDALAVPVDQIPASLESRAGLYRSLLANKRMLIVLDNARDAAQVRPLLPGAADCLVLVTSRNQLTGLAVAEHARLLSLDVLTDDEARELLAHQLGACRIAAEQEAVSELIRRCARLPLALSIAAARAVAAPACSLAAVVTALRDEPSRLDTLDAGDPASSLRTVFSWSYQQLSKPTARMFRLLGAHPGADISVPAAASLAGIAASQAGRLLGELTGASLLTEHSCGRYTFHDLLRAYAIEQACADPAELHAARLRALDHYLHTAFTATLRLEPHRVKIALGPAQPGVRAEPLASYQEALAWFDAELQVMLAAIALAADHRYDVHAWQLAWTMADFLNWRGRWQDWVATQQIALQACVRLGDLVSQGHARYSLARACSELGRYDDTRAHLAEALSLYRQTGDVLGRARCHIGMSAVAERHSSYDAAIEHAEHALELFRDAGYVAGQANALNSIGWCHAMAGHHALALRYCQQAIDLQRKLGNKLCEAGTWDSLGYAYHHLGQYPDAIACYRRALEFCQEVGHRRNQAEILDHLAETQQGSGDTTAAKDNWQRALDLLDDLHHPDADHIRAKLGTVSG